MNKYHEKLFKKNNYQYLLAHMEWDDGTWIDILEQFIDDRGLRSSFHNHIIELARDQCEMVECDMGDDEE